MSDKNNSLEITLKRLNRSRDKIDLERERITRLISEEKKKNQDETLPTIGEYIYLPEDYKFFRDDFTRLSCGGLVVVVGRNTDPEKYHNLTIGVLGDGCNCESSHNMHSYDINWEYLCDKQKRLES